MTLVQIQPDEYSILVSGASSSIRVVNQISKIALLANSQVNITEEESLIQIASNQSLIRPEVTQSQIAISNLPVDVRSLK
jgi:hypothetical protein